jgi:hypothetical protein
MVEHKKHNKNVNKADLIPSNNKIVINNVRKKIYYYKKKPYILYKGGAPVSLKEVYENITDEENLACFLQSNENILKLTSEIMFNLIKKSILSGMSDSEIINIMIEQRSKDDSTIITRPGFTIQIANEILNHIKNLNEYDEYIYNKCKDNYHKVMGFCYDFAINSTFISNIINNDLNLQNDFMKYMYNAFLLPDNLTFDEIKNYIDSSINKRIYLDFLVYASKCSISLYRTSISYMPYIRNKISNIKSTKPVDCHKNAINDYENDKIATADSWYELKDDMLFVKLFKKYNRTYLAGPSGSAILLYNLVFKILNISEDNKVLLLGCLIADYVPYFHTITEILITYLLEIDVKYNISIDPVQFTKNLLKSNLNIL